MRLKRFINDCKLLNYGCSTPETTDWQGLTRRLKRPLEQLAGGLVGFCGVLSQYKEWIGRVVAKGQPKLALFEGGVFRNYNMSAALGKLRI